MLPVNAGGVMEPLPGVAQVDEVPFAGGVLNSGRYPACVGEDFKGVATVQVIIADLESGYFVVELESVLDSGHSVFF